MSQLPDLRMIAPPSDWQLQSHLAQFMQGAMRAHRHRDSGPNRLKSSESDVIRTTAYETHSQSATESLPRCVPVRQGFSGTINTTSRYSDAPFSACQPSTFNTATCGGQARTRTGLCLQRRSA
ncbi:hypothetical protein C8T65DRAFT_632046 [Cerioporus squamosus]|nr:hypothetical protein C8T65DRAFT_632046 [Cerioporus squamosus]